ncbi:hypothetical protein [Fervidobacterium gondwanense]|uniref:Carbohydrate family 9 binding domain-like n=1 Tax=Fervidobacterium gondwanense DSM 13020 TaxID=1121883 RepID=A0A1M7T986_FERGO|nr:hypothetical protein [Fervidobacterium gondwanense]SHN67231.1 hypothetical protein SAMN02745226_01740 [Fervidobacterium gondwanense DSM 13020]
MKKVLWVFTVVLVGLMIASCDLLQKPPLLKTVTVDGNLSDWESYVYTDGATDSQWGVNNEIHKAGILFDATNLYIAGEFTKEGYNNFMVIVDLSGVTGAADTSKHPWGRQYKFEKGDVDFVIETWANGYNAWRFTSSEATGVSVTLASTETTGGRKRVEIAVPLANLGVTDASKLSLRAVFVLTGGVDDNGKQWAGDFYPNQGFETGDGGYTAPVVIKKTISNPTK